MFRVLVTVALVSLCFLNISCNHVDSKDRTRPEIAAANEAISIAVEAFSKQSKSSCEYSLISAEQCFQKGKYVWRIKFKSKDMLPHDTSAQCIGAGSEVFVFVDTKTKQATVTYGD